MDGEYKVLADADPASMDGGATKHPGRVLVHAANALLPPPSKLPRSLLQKRLSVTVSNREERNERLDHGESSQKAKNTHKRRH